MHRIYLHVFPLIALITVLHTCCAQDRRTVSEPQIPAVCETLQSKLAANKGALPEADEESLDTTRLQGALDHCVEGHALELAGDATHNAFLAGPFTIPKGVTLLIDRGITLFASRDPKLYELHPGSCGIVSDEHAGCKSFIIAQNAPHSGIMGDGLIDGRGGSKLLHGSQTWWDLAAASRGGGRQQVFRLIEIDKSDDFTFYRITLRNSPNFHITYRSGKGLTVWNLKIDTPKIARNTDGIDPSGSSDITVTNSFIRTGDDNIAIKGSAGGVQHMSVIDNHFYYGHGMSIGSETYDGVNDLLVRNLTLDGTDSGIRIKSNISRGGIVDRVVYEDVCIRDVKNPILINTEYNNPGPRDNQIPDYRGVVIRDVQIAGGGHIGVDGLDSKHRTMLTLDGVLVDKLSDYKFSAAHVGISYGPGPVNFRLSGEDILSGGNPGKRILPNCKDHFVPFPDLP